VKINATIEPFENLQAMNAAIDKGEKVRFFVDSTLANYETYLAAAEEIDVELIDMKELSDVASYDDAVVITDKELYMVKPHVFLRPASLVIGINCRTGTTSSEILGAIADACRKVGRSKKSIAAIASSVAKEEEIGVLATAQQIEVAVRFFNSEDLSQCIEKLGLKTSTIIDEKTGTSVANICEAAALATAKTDSLILEATLYENVMIAIAEAKARWWE
jgi:cobalt-precorrin 5A hydrolase